MKVMLELPEMTTLLCLVINVAQPPWDSITTGAKLLKPKDGLRVTLSEDFYWSDVVGT